MCRTGNEAAQQTTVLALGFCNPGHYELVLRDLQVVIEEYSNERLKVNPCFGFCNARVLSYV